MPTTQGVTTLRIDTHHHAIPSFYRGLLVKSRIDGAGGRALPEWSPEASLATMAELDVGTAILSVSMPGTAFLPKPADAGSLARDINDYLAEVVAAQRDRFGFFATVALPNVEESVDEIARALDDLNADGVVLLANNGGVYLGQDGQDDVFAALDARSAVVFIHPAVLPGPAVDGIAPFAADFLLDTTRAAYLLVRNRICSRYPNVKFILSHAGGFVPYASHRMAVTIMADTGRSLADVLDDFASFYFDTALSSSAAALPSLLAFAKPGHVTFGSDWPFAPVAAGKLFAAGLETYAGLDAQGRAAIERGNALALFPRLGGTPPPATGSAIDHVRHAVSRAVVRGAVRLINTR
ncbi:amidohydrolase family protein [Mycobacterium shigaense]|uniref:Amidohydrolase n=1 Tax=Mycobacterium shigaense TaxID=722731 RepID=A0A1Z4EK66_9MYCO|nr:amidohydrolase family protein [Mycobacterium shigaense]BAX93375.1 amidohydrolase [Mycobacterium shigaense]